MKTIPLIVQFKLYGVPFKLPLTSVRAADVKGTITDMAGLFGGKVIDFVPVGKFISVTLQFRDINTFQWLLLDDIKESYKAKLILHPKMCGETPTWEEDYNKKGGAK